KIARAGLQPDVEDVSFFLEPGASAVRALRACRKNRVGLGCKPGIGAGAGEKFDDLAIRSVVVERLAAALAQKNCDGDAPNALPRDAPVGARRDHVRQPLFTP